MAIDDNPVKMLKAGDTFYEPTGCLHRVSRNPSKKDTTRIIAVVLHPTEVKPVTKRSDRSGKYWRCAGASRAGAGVT